MAGLAGAIEVEQRAADRVIADLQRADLLVRHMAVGTGHPRPRMDPLAPQLELRVLRLQHRRPGCGMTCCRSVKV